MILASIVFLSTIGCVSSSTSTASFEVDQPRISQGLLTEEARDQGLAQLARQLDHSSPPLAAAAPVAGSKPAPAEPETKVAPAPEPAPTKAAVQAEGPGAETSAKATPSPMESAKLTALPKLSSTEIEELLSGLQLKLQVEKGYRRATADELKSLPALPEGLIDGFALAKAAPDGVALLRLAHRRFLSQPTQLWTQGVIVTANATVPGWQKNGDMDEIAPLVEALLASLAEGKKALGRDDVTRRLIRLSYTDVTGALAALKGFGVTTLEDVSQMSTPIEFEKLPVVAAMPSVNTNRMSLVGAEGKTERGAFDLSLTPSVATPLPGEVNTAPTSQLIVIFHPAHPEQFGRVRRLLDELIDRPDRQIFVEGMVLEINEEGLKELGIQWQFQGGNFEWLAGSLATPGAAAATMQFNVDTAKDLSRDWVARLKALVQDKKAEVLSRPSVLTVNNRQATIRVGTDIPIATSQQEPGAFAAPGTVAFNFKYLATGISLNVMPRCNEHGDQVSLLIDTIVSSRVPGADLELKSSSGALLAAAPTMATRRIQTYARIDNNTPFIIGGLVSKESTTARDKIPLLGDIPYLGVFFRSQRSFNKKTEVIIVLTPHILEPERGGTMGQYLPKDEDRFDEFGNKLFRDTYRIRSEDIFDLKFITANPRLEHYRAAARRALTENFRLAYVEPYNQFTEDRIPGESILVRRMVWEVVRRLSTEKGQPNQKWLETHVTRDRLIVFQSQQAAGGFNVQFLERVLAGVAGTKDFNSFLTNHTGHALAITFHAASSQGAWQRPLTVPIPEIRRVECRDQKAWNQQLWDLNQPDEQGRARFTIVLRDQSDLVRLQRAILVKKIVALNGGESQMSLSNFSLGKVLLMPEPKPHQFHPVDAEVAQYFFQIEKYYEVTLQLIEKALQEMEVALPKPKSESAR